jgi:hypothetical protein
MSLSAAYGPVSLSVNADYSTSNSSSQSDIQAVRIGKETTSKALQRVVERIREERIVKMIEEFEETNVHELAAGADGHNVGLFRWVDKDYKCEVKNEGKRLMFEFYVPEPAAFYLWAQNNQAKDISGKVIVKPINPKDPDPNTYYGICPLLSHHSIDILNYGFWAAEFGVKVDVPPPAIKIVTTAIRGNQTINKTADSDNALKAEDSDSISIPKGYKPVEIMVSLKYNASNPSPDAWAGVLVGSSLYTTDTGTPLPS